MKKCEGIRLLIIVCFTTALLFQTWGKISITDWVVVLTITLGSTGVSFTICSLLGFYDER